MVGDRRALSSVAIAAVPAAFLAIFFVWPLVAIITTGIWEEGALRLDAVADALGGRFTGVAWFTLWQAAASTTLTVAAALPAAWLFARFDFPGKRTIQAFATIPFVLPTVVVATAFLALLGPSGLLGIDLSGTIWAILSAHVFFNFAVVMRTVGALWSHLDPRLEDAARMLGASRVQAFREVTLPLLRPALAAAASIVFLFTFSSFGVVLILGGAGLTTLEVEIYRQTAIFFNLPVAAILALAQLVGVTAILVAYSRYQDRQSRELELRATAYTARRPRGRERIAVGGVLLWMTTILGVPLLVLVERAFRSPEGGYGLTAFRSLSEVGRGTTRFVAPWEAVGTSAGIAAVATVLAVIIGLMAAATVAYRLSRVSGWFDTLLMLPLGTSAVTIGFGMVVALDWPIDLRASWWLIPIAHALVAIPFVVRTAVPVMRSVRTRLREAAAMLGASPARAWREVDLPIVTRAAAVGAGFAFAISLGEFGATTFIARPDTTTMPVAIFRFLSQPGAAGFGRAMAMSVILMTVTALAMLVVERARVPGSHF